MIHELKDKFKSTIKTLEILYVVENVKPCARIMVYDENLKSILNFLDSLKLVYKISNFKVKKMDKGYYSDKSIKIHKNSKDNGYFFVYVSKEKRLASKALTYEDKNMHLELGMSLGYPKCCCEFFQKNFSPENYDLTINSLEKSEGYEFPFYTNITARHFDVSILNHFPCNFKCDLSIKLSQQYLKIIEKNSTHISSFFQRMLKNVVIYTKQGVFLLNDYQIINKEIHFKNVHSTIKNQFYNVLDFNKKIEVLDKKKIRINNNDIEEIGVMIFT